MNTKIAYTLAVSKRNMASKSARKLDTAAGPRYILCKHGHLERRLLQNGCATCQMLNYK